MTGRRRVEFISPRTARFVLLAAMALSAALILWAGRGTTLFSDELAYYGRLIEPHGMPQPFGAEYLLAPYAGHLQTLGKLVYELFFAVFGVSYPPLRILETALYLLCVGLFYVLASARVGSTVALAGSIVLLFMGAAWEVMLWPFDLHTLLALAAGLGAFAVLERGGRRADLVCCALLVVSVATIEVGLAFVAGVGVLILSSAERRSRIWVVALPVLLYAAWAVWASRYDQSSSDLSNLATLAPSIATSLASAVASLTGTISTGSDAGPFVVEPGFVALALAAIVAVAFLRRIACGGVAATSWALAATLAVYLASVAVADRRADSGRYMIVEAILLLLLAADLMRDVRFGRRAIVLLVALVAISLPLNLAKLFDGREALVEQADAVRFEYAMVELARDHVAPGYSPAEDPRVSAFAPALPFSLDASAYFAAEERLGSLAASLDEIRAGSDEIRTGADAALIGALGLKLRPASSPPAGCTTVTASEPVPPGGVLIEAGPRGVTLGLTRFSDSAPGVTVGELAAGEAAVLEIPVDDAPELWQLWTTGSVTVCPHRQEGPE